MLNRTYKYVGPVQDLTGGHVSEVMTKLQVLVMQINEILITRVTACSKRSRTQRVSCLPIMADSLYSHQIDGHLRGGM